MSTHPTPTLPNLDLPATLGYHMLEDWDDIYRRGKENLRPELVTSRAPNQSERVALERYTRRLGPVQTADTLRVGAAIDRLLTVNEDAPNGERRVLLIDGPSAMGKSHAVTAHLNRSAQRIWSEHGHRVNGRDVIPFVYLEVDSKERERGLMKSVLHFLGVPFNPRDTAGDLFVQFQRVARPLGVRAVVVDDAHMLRTADRNARQMTDFLKKAITGLPVSFIFVGAGLADSALMRQAVPGGSSAAQQILRRTIPLDMQPWDLADRRPDWERLLSTLAQLILIPGPRGTTTLRALGTLRTLHSASQGHPGLVIGWVKAAAETAIRTGQPLNQELLRASARDIQRLIS